MATIDSEIDVSAVKTRLLEGNASAIEYLQLESFVVPRLMIGLWQLSSPAWGFASKSKMLSQFQKHVDSGFTAYDMADHYGDAEIIFGQFRSSYSGPKSTFCATKYCVFEPITVTEDGMRNAVSQRLANIQSDKIDLLQFHWQDYNNSQYVRALQFLQDDERVAALGLCNFDTKRMEEVISVGVKVTTNQVQFSLIDARPTYAMAEACEKHHIKLLTYGTLCGGFLSEKWIAKDEPDPFSTDMTPSLRKPINKNLKPTPRIVSRNDKHLGFMAPLPNPPPHPLNNRAQARCKRFRRRDTVGARFQLRGGRDRGGAYGRQRAYGG
ncbi:conserved hypothetical protein [Histoplasma capsulatum H143]|uniref:NADP-dependent oxidoreductase domain-containing protein n=1 Tax=Ajellomyces capsulatus (strain H143) TaxID=544712 RepID=C6HK93_AJECH|nr:conserved hypothetical protein [Histoplasma capsulatum H143]